MLATRRRLLACAGATALLSACQQSGAGADKDDTSDMAIGDPGAPVRIVEYASVTCPHCRAWHEEVWPQLKANYIDKGKVRFIFREFPTNPVELAIAGFQVARCGGKTPAQYFSMLDVLFDQQDVLEDAYAQGTVKDKLLAVAKSSGVDDDAFAKCLVDPAGRARIKETVANGEKRFNVTGTPTLIIDGKMAGVEAVQYDTLAKAIDAKLNARAKTG